MRILIADDHTLMRKGLHDGMGRLFPDAMVFEAGSAGDTLEQISRNGPFSIAVVDLFMPDMNGFCFIKALHEAAPELPIVVITASGNPFHAKQALASGARAYVEKTASENEFLVAIHRSMDGETYLSEGLAVRMAGEEGGLSADQLLLESRLQQLTPRQLDILVQLGTAKSNKEIAYDLDLSENTIKIHVSAILKVLGLTNRTQAGLLARKLYENEG